MNAHPEDRPSILRHPVATELEKNEIRQRIRKNTMLSFAFGIPGLLAQVGGRVMMIQAEVSEGPEPAVSASGYTGCAVIYAGLVLLIVGLGFAAKAKGRKGWWGLFGLLSCIGLLILYYLGKVCARCGENASHSAPRCSKCEAPL
jgi:hypothetical protein